RLRQHDRQGIELGVAVLVLDVDEGKARRLIPGQRQKSVDAGLTHPLPLAAKPALTGEKSRKCLGEARRAGDERFFPVDAGRYYRQGLDRFGWTHRHFLSFEAEPVETVGPEGEEVGLVADGGEFDTTEELDGHHVAKARKVDTNRLD